MINVQKVKESLLKDKFPVIIGSAILLLLVALLLLFINLRNKQNDVPALTPPKISIVMPVYNSENYLRYALNSILDQTFQDFEIICINDGSRDNSLKILKEYAQKHNNIRIYSQRNQGAGVARNKGLELARGKYIMFLDSDDVFRKEMLETLYNKAEKTNSDIVVCGNISILTKNNIRYKITYNTDIWVRELPRKEVFNRKDTPYKIFNFTYFQAWNKFYSREFLIKNNIKFQNSRYLEDLDFTFTSLAVADRITTVKNKFVVYFERKNNPLHKSKREKEYFYKAFYQFKQDLINRNLFRDISFSYYDLVIRAFWHELNLGQDEKTISDNVEAVFNLVPIEYLQQDKLNYENLQLIRITY